MVLMRFHEAHLVGGNREELDQVRAELPRPQAHVQSRRERVGLVAGLAVQRDDAAVGKVPVSAEQHEFLGDDADAVVGHHDHAEEPQHRLVAQQQQDDGGDDGDRRPVIDHGIHGPSLRYPRQRRAPRLTEIIR